MKRRLHINTYLILVCLLHSTSVGAGGFCLAATDSRSITLYSDFTVPQREGTTLDHFLLFGGMLREEENYWICEEGIGNLVDFNFVDGLSLGPKLTWGHFLADRSRWEVSPVLRWSLASHRFSGDLAVRYCAPVEQERWIEISGGEYTQDFNRNPFLTDGQSALAMSFFGWDHAKFYRLTHATLCGGTSLGADWLFSAGVEWQRCQAVQNHRWQSFFGKHISENGPDFATHQVMKLSARATYTPGRRVVVFNDMESQSLSPHPTFGAAVEATTRASLSEGWNHLRRRERWELSVTQPLNLRPGRLTYYAEGGFFTGRRNGLLMDMKHFDASRFVWQTHESLTWFSRLDDYRLSTDRAWLMACAELSGRRLFLSRWGASAGWWPPEADESVAVNLLQVDGADLHSEYSYSWKFRGLLTLGVTVAFDGADYESVALRLVTLLK